MCLGAYTRHGTGDHKLNKKHRTSAEAKEINDECGGAFVVKFFAIYLNYLPTTRHIASMYLGSAADAAIYAPMSKMLGLVV